MRKRRTRREIEVFSLSFLDCICCGFGAIILLLCLVKINEPKALEAAAVDRAGRIAKLEEELAEIRGESTILQRELDSRVRQLSTHRDLVARLRGDLSKIQGEFKGSKELSEVQEAIEGRLLLAQQQLTDEQKRLQAQQSRPRPKDSPVGGIPVDSEYVLFVIDTSGSMTSLAWPLMVQKMSEVLDAYPQVKGLQVMNDEGHYMFGTYSGKWIPDTPARRKAVIERLSSWNSYSNSSPVEGIEAAIRTFARNETRMSIYVFGDEFTGKSMEDVVMTVDRLNRRGGGERKVRIHAIGFPTMFSQNEWPEQTGLRFATLMRILCDRNGGAFVGLNSVR
jgi:hypothetical protein